MPETDISSIRKKAFGPIERDNLHGEHFLRSLETRHHRVLLSQEVVLISLHSGAFNSKPSSSHLTGEVTSQNRVPQFNIDIN